MLVEAGITSRSFTITGLLSGNTYEFKVRARNQVGYGDFSNTVSVLASQVPDQPLAPTTTRTGDNILIAW